MYVFVTQINIHKNAYCVRLFVDVKHRLIKKVGLCCDIALNVHLFLSSFFSFGLQWLYDSVLYRFEI